MDCEAGRMCVCVGGRAEGGEGGWAEKRVGEAGAVMEPEIP